MRHTWRFHIAAAVVVGGLGAARPAAAQLSFVFTRGVITGTTVDWGVLGATGTPVLSGVTLPVGGAQVTVTTGTGGAMRRVDQADPTGGACSPSPAWLGNFLPCEHLLDVLGNGSMTFTFNQLVSGFGTNVQLDQPGSFLAQIDVFRGATLLGSFSNNGLSYFLPNGAAPFVGALSLSAATDFDRVVVSTPPYPGFAVDGPVVAVPVVLPPPPSTTTPEPASLTLLGTGLATLGTSLRRRGGAHA